MHQTILFKDEKNPSKDLISILCQMNLPRNMLRCSKPLQDAIRVPGCPSDFLTFPPNGRALLASAEVTSSSVRSRTMLGLKDYIKNKKWNSQAQVVRGKCLTGGSVLLSWAKRWAEKEKGDEQAGVEYILLVALSSFRHAKAVCKSWIMTICYSSLPENFWNGS